MGSRAAQLIVTDLDGTLFDTPGDLPLSPNLRGALLQARRAHEIVSLFWG